MNKETAIANLSDWFTDMDNRVGYGKSQIKNIYQSDLVLGKKLYLKLIDEITTETPKEYYCSSCKIDVLTSETYDTPNGKMHRCSSTKSASVYENVDMYTKMTRRKK